MSNEQLIRRFYDDMWNKFDKDLFPEILDAGITFRGSLGIKKSGYRGLSEYIDFIQSVFPDFHNEILLTISEGSKSFARLRYTGTHQGDLLSTLR